MTHIKFVVSWLPIAFKVYKTNLL